MGELTAENEPPKEVPKETVKINKKAFCLEILKLIKEAQQQHGLRHGDYQRYRGYCSRRIRRLRKTLKLPQGDKKHFKRRNVMVNHLSSAKGDKRYLHIPLVEAERAWAYAMQLRQEANTEPRKKFHMLAKLKKACVHAVHLEELCKSAFCDARTKLESQAYVGWLRGTLQFETQAWEGAAENLKKAQLIYENLLTALPEDEQSPYRQRVDELSSSIRYCAYNIGDEEAVNILELRGQGLLENLDTLMVQAREKQSEQTYEKTWFGQKVIVRNANVRSFLHSLDGLEEGLEKAEGAQGRVQILDQVLIDCRDAIAVARDDLKQGGATAQLVLSYLLYLRLLYTVERNVNLVELAKKSQDCVRLYEIILQQMGELQQLSGMEGNAAYQEEVKAQSYGYRGLRCYHMAKAMAEAKKWRETAALCARAYEHHAKAKASQALKERMDRLHTNVAVEEMMARAQSVLEVETEEPVKVSAKARLPLIDRLDEYIEDPQLLSKTPNLVKLPPDMTAVPAKPFFYDLALNFIEFPDLQDKIEDPAKPKATAAAASVSGFVKGLLGWGSTAK